MDAPYISIAEPKPHPLVLMGDSGPLVTIHPNGDVEFGEGCEPTEAAHRFWKALGLTRKEYA